MPHPKIVHTHYTHTFLVLPRSLQGTTNDCIPTRSVGTPSQLAKITKKLFKRQFTSMARRGSTSVLQPLGYPGYIQTPKITVFRNTNVLLISI
jgi:hypothetical protein